jgi:predicted dehydrogenase
VLNNLPLTRIEHPRIAPAIRWGVLAPGNIARGFAHAVTADTSSTITAVGSRSLERATAFLNEFGDVSRGAKAYGSYEELVNDENVDAIYIASPHSEHHAHVTLALEANKPVLVEKAFTRNAAEARDLVRLAREKNLLLVEAMWTRFLPHIDIVRQLVESGELGEIETIIADHGQFMTFPLEHRLQNPALAGGALLDMGIYPLSFMYMVLGQPDAINTTATLTATGVDETLSATLRWKSAHGLMTTSQKVKTPTTATVSGTRARIEIPQRFYGPNAVRLIYTDGTELISHPESAAGMAYEAAEFARLLHAGRTESDLMPLDESVAIMATMDQMRAQVGVIYPGE